MRVRSLVTSALVSLILTQEGKHAQTQTETGAKAQSVPTTMMDAGKQENLYSCPKSMTSTKFFCFSRKRLC